jgi:hypothetical protein
MVVVTPVVMAVIAGEDIPPERRPDLFARLAILWLAGFAAGLSVVLASARRGDLILRSPRQMVSNLRWQRRLIGLMVAVTLALVLLLPHVGFAEIDWRISLVVVVGGFLFPMLPVILYITFRIRPDEIYSDDPAAVQAAARRWFRE